MVIIVGVIVVVLILVFCGFDGGVKVFSNINMSLVGLLLFFIIFVGFIMIVLEILWVIFFSYVGNFVGFSNLFGCEDEVWF